MTADDLSAPLGQEPAKRQGRLPALVLSALVGALALFLGVFVLWAIVGDNPFGGEPMVAVPIDSGAAMIARKSGVPAGTDAIADRRHTGQSDTSATRPSNRMTPAKMKTVTIINGETGARQEVEIPAATENAGAMDSSPFGQKFLETTAQGLVPKIAADGTWPAEAFAQPVRPLPGKPDAPRVALIVAGLGVSTRISAEAIATLPGAVTLAFMPYTQGIKPLVARARATGHEVLLQVPMEPFNYPDNDPGPKTLLTSLTAQQNIDRLHWLMGRFQDYVGIIGAMGARFTASERSFVPILRETAKRGLIFVDDGSNARSVAARIAGADNLPFAKADIGVDSVPTPSEIDHALGRLEMSARVHGAAVGLASALPVSIEHVAKWAKAATRRGVLLVPITAVALKRKPAMEKRKSEAGTRNLERSAGMTDR